MIFDRHIVGRKHRWISEIGLPEEDGYALVRRIRQREAERGGFLPAITLTGYARTDDRTRALAAGFQAHVAKPRHSKN